MGLASDRIAGIDPRALAGDIFRKAITRHADLMAA